jgi:hypothetical protein
MTTISKAAAAIRDKTELIVSILKVLDLIG